MSSYGKVKINDCFIIHLETAIKRTNHVNYLKKKIPQKVSVIPAVDGKKLNKEELRYYKPNILCPTYPFKLKAAEIATFLSHRVCWQKIIDDGLDGALIIEDDVRIDNAFFSYHFEKALKEIRAGDFIRFPMVIGLGMQAQIVTKDAAYSLLRITQNFDRPVDTYLQLKWIHEVKILTALPSGISEISNRLGGSLIGNKKSLYEKFFREIIRPIYKVKVYFISLFYALKL